MRVTLMSTLFRSFCGLNVLGRAGEAGRKTKQKPKHRGRRVSFLRSQAPGDDLPDAEEESRIGHLVLRRLRMAGLGGPCPWGTLGDSACGSSTMHCCAAGAAVTGCLAVSGAPATGQLRVGWATGAAVPRGEPSGGPRRREGKCQCVLRLRWGLSMSSACPPRATLLDTSATL